MDLEETNTCPPSALLSRSPRRPHLGVIGYQTVLADIDPMFEAEQVGHLPLGALAKPHGRPWGRGLSW